MTNTRRRKFALSAAELHDWLRPVLPLASTDDMLPVLCTVAFRGHGTTLSAAATDRFRAGVSVHELRAHPDEKNTAVFDTAAVPTAALRQALALFKPKRNQPGHVAITIKPGESITFDGGVPLVGRVSVTFDLETAEYPNIWQVIAEANADHESGETVPVTSFNPAYLADLKALAPGKAWGEPVVVRMPKLPNRPTGFSTSTFAGVIMPSRLEGAEYGAVPALSDPLRAVLPMPDAPPAKVAA